MGDRSMGLAVKRLEDARLVSGRGRFVADIDLHGQLYGIVLRSPHAHAEIEAINARAARRNPHVAAVFTGADLDTHNIGPVPCIAPVSNADGSPIVRPPRPVLARERVRYVGEPVAFVVATSRDAALDAAEAIDVDYRTLPVQTRTGTAIEADAAQIWSEAKRNVCFTWSGGDAAATADAFDRAAQTVTLSLVNNRLVPNPIEPRGAIAEYDAARQRFKLYTCSQGPYLIRLLLAEPILRIPQADLQVITPDVGGGFGVKAYAYPEHAMVAMASRALGRPVKWEADRSEAFLADTHGRDHATEAELALDGTGRFLAARYRVTANMGAYPGVFGPAVPTIQGLAMASSVYRFEAIHVEVTGVFTNTPPVDIYRGAGRPEPIYALERLIDRAARESGEDPAELRRRNLIPSADMPAKTAANAVYDTGDFATNLADVLDRAAHADVEARKADSARRGKLRGFGISYYIEQCAHSRDEAARVRVEPSGEVSVYSGAQSSGQGHETALAQIVADRLGIPVRRVRVRQGDSDAMAYGFGTFASRTLAIAGHAILEATDRVIQCAKTIATELLEASEADIEFANGSFTVPGTDRTVSFEQVAGCAYNALALPPGAPFGLEAGAHYAPSAPTFPNGAHACEVEIDPETGAVAIERYTVTDDFGTLVNPDLVHGQVHGGIAQGLGQALLEDCRFDPETGQPLNASFLDYALPRADELPMFDVDTIAVPCTTNRLGVKGAGEAGTIGSPPAAINAILDALQPLGVRHIDMPATPHGIWQAIRNAGGKA